MLETNLTVAPDEFSIDNMPPTVELRIFDGHDPDLPRIPFRHPLTGIESSERSALVTNFCFNGTALLTPSAFDDTCGDLNVDTIDRSRLTGDLLILDLEPGVKYDENALTSLIQEAKITPPISEAARYIVLFRTRLMARVLL
jgi:hypothetical protein